MPGVLFTFARYCYGREEFAADNLILVRRAKMNQTMKASIKNEFNHQMKSNDERLKATINFYAILFDLALVKAMEGNVTSMRFAGTFQKIKNQLLQKMAQKKNPGH